MVEAPEKEILTPEVLPPEGKPPPRSPRSSRVLAALVPVLCGLLIDSVDFRLFGPLGLLFGVLAGFWLALVYRLPARQRIVVAALSGFYGVIRMPRFLPLATTLGIYLAVRQALRDDG